MIARRRKKRKLAILQYSGGSAKEEKVKPTSHLVDSERKECPKQLPQSTQPAGSDAQAGESKPFVSENAKMTVLTLVRTDGQYKCVKPADGNTVRDSSLPSTTNCPVPAQDKLPLLSETKSFNLSKSIVPVGLTVSTQNSVDARPQTSLVLAPKSVDVQPKTAVQVSPTQVTPVLLASQMRPMVVRPVTLNKSPQVQQRAICLSQPLQTIFIQNGINQVGIQPRAITSETIRLPLPSIAPKPRLIPSTAVQQPLATIQVPKISEVPLPKLDDEDAMPISNVKQNKEDDREETEAMLVLSLCLSIDEEVQCTPDTSSVGVQTFVETREVGVLASGKSTRNAASSFHVDSLEVGVQCRPTTSSVGIQVCRPSRSRTIRNVAAAKTGTDKNENINTL